MHGGCLELLPPKRPVKIHVNYLAQLKPFCGRERETVEMGGAPTIRAVLGHLVEAHGPKLRDMLLTGEGRVRPSILVFADEHQVDPESPEPLADGQTLTLLSPMAGG